MKQLSLSLHGWLSLPFGLIISIVCLSGASLVFEQETTERLYPRRYFVEGKGRLPLPLDRLAEQAARSLPDSIAITGITVSADPSRTWRLSLSQPPRTSVYVDPYTGEITGRQERGAFFTCMFRMHRWLLDSGRPEGRLPVGKILVGASTLVLVFILITGIRLWAGRARKSLKNRLRVAVGKGRHRFWYDLHVSAGFYAAVVLLVLALTGLTWSFSWYRTAFYAAFGVTNQPAGAGHGVRSAAQGSGKKEARTGGARTKTADFSSWQSVYDRLSRQHPGYKEITISSGSASVSFGRAGNRRAADRYTFDPQTGEITQAIPYRAQDRAGKIRGWIYSVHVGSWGGLFTRVLTFLAALTGGLLPLTGYYLWFRKRAKKARRRKQAAGSCAPPGNPLAAGRRA